VIRDVQIFDGERLLPRADVLIEDDRIADHDGRRVDIEVDGAGNTLIPGLIDAHTHVFDGDLDHALRFGVTTELDMFCLPANLRRQRRLATDRDDVADIRSAGTLATAPAGYPTHIMTPELRRRSATRWARSRRWPARRRRRRSWRPGWPKASTT
jgi:imidazolonepropionase-like amidohydrolase